MAGFSVKTSLVALNLGIIVGFFSIYILVQIIQESSKALPPLAVRSWKSMDDQHLLDNILHTHITVHAG